MNLELLKTLAPYFTSILGAVVAIGIAIFTNSSKAKSIQNKLSKVDDELHELKNNHFFHLGEYLKKLNAFLRRGKLMDEVEKADMDSLADGVAGKKQALIYQSINPPFRASFNTSLVGFLFSGLLG